MPPALSYFLPFFDVALPPPLGFLAPPLLPGPLSGIGNSFLPAIVLRQEFECQGSQSTVIPSVPMTRISRLEAMAACLYGPMPSSNA